ncbi:MAG: SDR family NAD(P)-dependent oxidoreductase, partial [Desulfosarcinaceae bacterium]
ANRAVLRSLDDFRSAGHKVEYFALDVCDGEAVKQAMGDITERLGPVKALIHGAGVLEDRLIIDKTDEQWQRVYNTKVQGLENLLQALDQDSLGYIVLFSSVAARLGNQGQSDYAMANEVLNKTAVQLAAGLPGCKVVSLNWGPWDGGMVTATLKRNFSNRGISLISLEQGTRAMLAEMASPRTGDIEVVLGASLDDSRECEPASIRTDATAPEGVLNLAAKREIDVERVPVLQAHRLDGRPVVPFALITEWLAHSALHANPGLTLHGLDHLRLCKGIVLDQGGKMIRLMAGNAKRNGQAYEVDVEIRNGVQDGMEVVHSRAKAILTDQLPSAPPFTENGHFKSGPGRHTLEEIYSSILFHGKELHGIKQVIRLTKEGMTCLISAAPKPDLWMTDPLRSRWIADPLVLDSAFQMAIVWCYDQMGLVCLPSYAMSYRQYRDRFPLEGVSAVMEIHKASNRKMVGDFTFLDGDKTVVARLEGYEAVIDKDLIRSFKGKGHE